MPLRKNCSHCGRELLLDEAFYGAYCRCQHCRSLIQIPRPPDYAAKRPTVRPARPSLAGQKRVAGSTAPTAASRRSSLRAQFPLRRLRSPVVIASIAFVGAISITFAAWHLTGPSSPQAMNQIAMSGAPYPSSPLMDPDAAKKGPALALQTADPLKTYFGFPLAGKTIGYVVDGDSTMAPYIDNVAVVTNAVNDAIDRGTCRFGIVLASGEQGHAITEVAEPSTDLAGARSLLTARLPAGETDLSGALLKTGGWYADVIFLVLAKPVNEDELAVLTENAEQTGAVTHVIALGEAAKQDLSPIATATGGQFLRVSDEMLKASVERVQRRRQAKLAEQGTP